eukprot:TRINITY_DN955_c0_g1_i1.p2 TRINITY_DN955_c0_g1~~TRINITY_DN955_c0_g1_i1.p2  ORF type:complete len:223 (+),score=21.14 TRINITY_DN955_c0_g1_i1:189-857(+)
MCIRDRYQRRVHGIGHGYQDLAVRPDISLARVLVIISGRIRIDSIAGIRIPDPTREQSLHPFGDLRQGDEFGTGREGEKHGPRGSSKDVPVMKGGETGDQQRHNDKTEQDCRNGEGDQEDLEFQETLKSKGPGHHGSDDKDAHRECQGNDVRHAVERPQQDPEYVHNRPAPIVQHQCKAQEQAEEHRGRDNPVRQGQEGIGRYELVDEVERGFCGKILGAEE